MSDQRQANAFMAKLQMEQEGILKRMYAEQNIRCYAQQAYPFVEPKDTRSRARKAWDKARWRVNALRRRLGFWIAGATDDE